jgi:hypothetical protein
MMINDLLAAFDDQMRRAVRPEVAGARIERDGGVVRQIAPAGGWNGVVWSDLDGAGADAVIEAQVRHFTALGRDFEWKHYSHDRPGDLGERLLAAGFAAEAPETVLVAEISTLPTEIALPDGVTLRTVTDAAGADLVAEVHDAAFGAGGDRIRGRVLAELAASPGTVAAVVAMVGEVPVCAARMELHEGTDFASLWGGGTVEEWRGRGIYRALVAYRNRIATEHGYRFLQVDASEDSRPILQRLGFVAISVTTPYNYEVSK